MEFFFDFYYFFRIEFKNNPNETIDKILQRADALLYEAKK